MSDSSAPEILGALHMGCVDFFAHLHFSAGMGRSVGESEGSVRPAIWLATSGGLGEGGMFVQPLYLLLLALHRPPNGV